jgi:hypothetical protein
MPTTEKLVRIVCGQPCDEVNSTRFGLHRVSYDGGFWVPRALADELIASGPAGFDEAPLTPSEIIADVARVIERLPDDHRWKTALNQALAGLPDDADPA